MANVVIDDSSLVDIANVIRSKNGLTRTYKPREMAQAILEIVTEKVDAPSQDGSLTYTGSAQAPQWAGYDADIMTIGGTTSAVNAGAYEATFTLASGYAWADGTSGAKSVNWTIGKAASSIVPQFYSKSLSVGNSYEASLTITGDGYPEASSANTRIVKAYINTHDYKHVGLYAGTTTGTTTVSVWVAEGTNYAKSDTKKITVTVS